jgi:putative hydrolase of the HAD superfamily
MLFRRELKAVTIDAFGTLVELDEPVGRLRAALAELGVQRSRDDVERAFAAEVAYYLPRAWLGRDELSLAELRQQCVEVFLGELGTELDAESFVRPFADSIVMSPIAGTGQALERLRAAGLRLACVSNWDYLLPEQIGSAGLAGQLEAIVSSAEAGAAKPDPAVFHIALERLGVEPREALHIGDQEVDEEGALAAGMRFEPTPLVTLPERLGL